MIKTRDTKNTLGENPAKSELFSDTKIVSFRIAENILDELDLSSIKNKMSTNYLMQEILTRWVEDNRFEFENRKISFDVTPNEFEAIKIFADSCGLSIHELIKKCVLSDITFQDFYKDCPQYDYDVNMPNDIPHEKQNEFLLNLINKIRIVLDLNTKSDV